MIKNCVVCGKPFTVYKKKITCSDNCSLIRHREVSRLGDKNRRKKIRMIKSKEKRKCPVCGKSFTVCGKKAYCSERCKNEAARKRKRERYLLLKEQVKDKRLCSCCGKEFETNIRRRKYCSDECKETMKKKKSAECNLRRRIKEREMLQQKATSFSKSGIDITLAAAKEAGLDYGQYKAIEFLERQKRIRVDA